MLYQEKSGNPARELKPSLHERQKTDTDSKEISNPFLPEAKKTDQFFSYIRVGM
jgi:hypothetical protein